MEDIKKEGSMGKEGKETVQETKPESVQGDPLNNSKEGLKEDNMNQEREQTKPKFVQGDPLNSSKGGLTRREFLKKAGVAIAGAAAGIVLPDALTNKARADAPVEPVYTRRVFLPQVTKEVSTPEPPLYLREFGAPERGVIMRNKVEQGGGNPAYVEMGDQELFENMMYLRETYGRPDLKLEITFYSSKDLLLRDPQAPRWIQENHRGVLNYDSWAGGNGTFENGSILFKYDEGQKTLRFYITLPETIRGKIPIEGEVNQMHAYFVNNLKGNVFLAGGNGRSNLSLEQWNDPAVYQDLINYPAVVQDSPRRVTNSSIWIKLETIPTTGGK